MPGKFVFDTNAIVSAVLLKTSISRKKYISESLRIEFLAAYLREATLIEVKERIVACRDRAQ